MADEFTREERAALAPYVSNLDGPVFALVDLPEVVKGALFARYSRSPKSLRRLFVDEFVGAAGLPPPPAPAAAHTEPGPHRADQPYDRGPTEYADDSGAQPAAGNLRAQ